jgi:protein-L-isoaspartate O-methyltransferase
MSIHTMNNVHRYLFAAEYAKDKDVLDIDCGEGFGSAILAKNARSVMRVPQHLTKYNVAIIRR